LYDAFDGGKFVDVLLSYGKPIYPLSTLHSSIPYHTLTCSKQVKWRPGQKTDNW